MVYPDGEMTKYVLDQINYHQITDLSITGIIHSDDLPRLKTPRLRRAHLSLMVLPHISLSQILDLADGIPRIRLVFVLD